MMAAAERVMARADELAAISETAEGLTRVYLAAAFAGQSAGGALDDAGGDDRLAG